MSNSNFSGIETNGIVIADSEGFLTPRSVATQFQERPTFHAAIGYGSPVGTTGATNIMLCDSTEFEYHIKGTQTILAPVFTATGLDIAMDQTANDGVELSNGITTRQKAAYLIGRDQFFAECTFVPADVSGSDDLAFGFRTAEAYQANIDDYNNMAVLNSIAGAVSTETILNNAATVTTSTGVTIADGATVTFRLEVLTDGSVKYFVNGNQVTPTSTFKFDQGDVVVPFLFFLQDTDLMNTLVVQKWNAALLQDRTTSI